MIFQIELAKTIIEIASKCASTPFFLEEFIVDNGEPDYFVVLNRADLELEWKHTTKYDDDYISSIKRIWTPGMERQAIYHKIIERLPSFSTILMHGVVISDGQHAYMISAPSGEGKSTRATVFIERHPNYFILNGDKPLVRVEGNRVIACGSPWKGKENYGVNAEAPLKAIFLLERADETELTELTIGEAFDFLVKQTYIPSDPVNAVKALQLLKSFEGKVRLFQFRSTPTIESVEAAWRAANS